MNTLLYISYGRGPHEKEVEYSILSAQRWSPSGSRYRVLVLTDHPNSFAGVDAQVKFIAPQQWKEWSGPANFPHRRKILALQHAMSISDGAVILLDGDTWLRAPAECLFDRVASGSALMHIREGRVCEIDTPLLKSVHHLLQQTALTDSQGTHYKIPTDAYMWNAGVIGLHPDNIDLLAEVLTLTDQLCERSNLHILEQLAFSYTLSQRTLLREADDLVFHYWPPYLHAPFRHRITNIFANAERLQGQERLEYLFANRPQPTWSRRGKVLLKRCAQLLGLIRGRCRSNEW